MSKLKINFLGKELNSPLLPASGTFGIGDEFAKYFDLNILGAMVPKSVTKEERLGNKLPRATWTEFGLLNAIGLANPGIIKFKEKIVKFSKDFPKLPIILNLSATSIDDFKFLINDLENVKNVFAYELNLSCPNVKEGGIELQQSPEFLKKLFTEIRKATSKKLIVKFSPEAYNLLDACRIAKNYKMDAVSLINTIKGTKIDIYKRQPILTTTYGGYSGPAIKPIALRHVHEVYAELKIPIIGIGGISTAEDVIEFLMAGAQCVQIGSQNFTDPFTMKKISLDLEKLMKKLNIKSLSEIIGCCHK